MIDQAAYLREDRENGNTGMPAHHRDIHGGNVETILLRVEGLSADNIEGCHTHDLPLVVHTHLLQLLCRNRHCRVDWVGDNIQNGSRAMLANCFHETTNDTGVDLQGKDARAVIVLHCNFLSKYPLHKLYLEKIVPGHARLPWYTSRDNHKVTTTKRLCEAVFVKALRRNTRKI